MIRKRILICDDDSAQYTNLAQQLDPTYDVRRSTDYRSVLDDLEKLKPVHLLILDLGFPPGGYVGHERLPDILRLFPNVKVLVRSDILTRADRREDSVTIARSLVTYPHVVGFLSTADAPARIEFEVSKALGTPLWSPSGDLWLLHLSDLQFGGAGLEQTPDALAVKLVETLEAFARSIAEESPSTNAIPFMIFATGDISEHARPKEFEDAGVFLRHVSDFISERRYQMAGSTGKSNVVVIPGNHDINWDMLRAQNLWSAKDIPGADATEPLVYLDGNARVRSELSFIHEYAWLPYSHLHHSLPPEERHWAWNPGYRIIDLKRELRLVLVLINSSRWGITHVDKHARVPPEVWIAISKKLEQIDADRSAARLLLVHHTIYEGAPTHDRLSLGLSGDDPAALIDMISRTCNIAVVFTGHIHTLSVRNVDMNTDRRKLVHVGAGTVRSSALGAFSRPEFNIVRITGLDPATNKYTRLTVYPYEWDGTSFKRYSAFDDGQEPSRDFELRY